MKLHAKIIFFLFIALAHSNLSKAQYQLDAFSLIGTKGVGLGVKYKNLTVYAKYYYEYFGNPRVYEKKILHTPSIGFLINVYKEQQVNLYTGFDYRVQLWEPKYFLPGVNGMFIGGNDYYFAVPLGIEVKPFRSWQNLSIIAETGLELQHYNFPYKGRAWNINLWRGIFEIRYQFGKRTRVQ